MRRGGIDRLFRLCCIGQVNAAEFDPLGRCRELRLRMIDTGHSRAARKGSLGDHLAKRAQGAGDDRLYPSWWVSARLRMNRGRSH